MPSKLVLLPICVAISYVCIARTKEQLRNGTLLVSGNQWPIFLYQGFRYDEEDPWNGLFRSSLLILVSSFLSPLGHVDDQVDRHSNMFSLHPVQSTKSQRPLGQEMRAYTA
jgi:hypothetical protein